MPLVSFPLPLRNALAEVVIAALEDPVAAGALAWLAHPDAPPAPAVAAHLAAVHLIDPGGHDLLAVHAPHASAVAAHAGGGLRAAAAYQPPPCDAPIPRALRQAAALWDAHLFFEVHEVLEAVWKTEGGARRQALQGLIQLAVAFHHARHGNTRGARTLMTEGRARLASVPPDTLAPIDIPTLLERTSTWEAALQQPTPPPSEAPPSLPWA